ncbi:hypothetical protein TNCV_494751 [Trichonephila clavipes]|nr:hypothetical protein TNCV_494751 [Trichonephila clavipes]
MAGSKPDLRFLSPFHQRTRNHSPGSLSRVSPPGASREKFTWNFKAEEMKHVDRRYWQFQVESVFLFRHTSINIPSRKVATMSSGGSCCHFGNLIRTNGYECFMSGGGSSTLSPRFA